MDRTLEDPTFIPAGKLRLVDIDYLKLGAWLAAAIIPWSVIITIAVLL